MCRPLRLLSLFFIRASGAVLPIRADGIAEGQSRQLRNNIVGKDFFAAMGIPVKEGRNFGPQDTKDSQKIAVINEAAVKFSPLGHPLVNDSESMVLNLPKRSKLSAWLRTQNSEACRRVRADGVLSASTTSGCN